MFNNLKNRNFNYKYSPYIFVSLIIFIFNYYSVFNIKYLIHDDPILYHYAAEDTNWYPEFFRLWFLLGPEITWLTIKLSLISISLSRLFLVIAFMIPTSLILFKIIYKQFGLPLIPSLVCSVLPCIIPSQTQIPIGINSSYPLPGLTFGIISLYLVIKYLEQNKNHYYLISSIILLFIATQISSSAFLLIPAFIFICIVVNGQLRKKIIIILSNVLILAIVIIWGLFVPRKEILEFELPNIFERLNQTIIWVSPINIGDNSLVFILFFILIILLAVLLLIRKSTSNNAGDKNKFKSIKHLQLMTFGILWYFSSISVFLIVESFHVRYFYQAGFGLIFTFILSIYILFSQFLKKNNYINIILIFIMIFYGISYIKNIKTNYAAAQKSLEKIKIDLNNLDFKNDDFPENSQIVLFGYNLPYTHDGTYLASSGILKYIFHRHDISGIIGSRIIHYYYNPFQPKDRQFFKRISGLDYKNPTYFFVKDSIKTNLRQYEYILQWNEEFDSYWVIYKYHKKTGYPSFVIDGFGIKEYEDKLIKLQKMNINQSDILWGQKKMQYSLTYDRYSKDQYWNITDINNDSIIICEGNGLDEYLSKSIKHNIASSDVFLGWIPFFWHKTVVQKQWKSEKVEQDIVSKQFSSAIIKKSDHILCKNIQFGDDISFSAIINENPSEFYDLFLLFNFINDTELPSTTFFAITVIEDNKNIIGFWPTLEESLKKYNTDESILIKIKLKKDLLNKDIQLGIRINLDRKFNCLSPKSSNTDQNGCRILIPLKIF